MTIRGDDSRPAFKEPGSDDEGSGEQGPEHLGPEELAAEYFVRREDEGEVDVAPYLARLGSDADRARFLQLVGGAERASKAVGGAPPEHGRLFHGRYEILRTIGEGGMGRVYLARDRELGRTVALKVMNTLGREASDRAMLLLKESRLLAALRHPNIVAVHDSGLEGEQAWLVMDYVDGRSLADVIEHMRDEVKRSASGRIAARDGAQWSRAIGRPAEAGRPSLLDERDWYRTCASVVCELARTLEAAHGQGVIHRDLKPANVMLLGGGHPVVLDFGLGGSAEAKSGEVTENLFGSVPYMAPEQVKEGRVGLDPRTDVYQLGLILYELLTLRRAFPGTEMMEVLERVRQGAYDRPRKHNPGVPRELEAICTLALEHSPDRRYASARALREDLEAVLAGTRMPVALRSDRTRAVLRSARVLGRRHPVLAGLAATLVVGVGSWSLTKPSARPEILPFKTTLDAVTGASAYVEIENGTPVRGGDTLGVSVHWDEPLVLYAFSVFSTQTGEERIWPAELQFFGAAHPAPFQGYGFEIPPCESDETASCPRVECARVDEANRMESLIVLACPEPRVDLEEWMLWMRAVANAESLPLASALDGFKELSARPRTTPKGGRVRARTDAERAQLSDSMRRALQSQSFLGLFGEDEHVALYFPVVGK